MVGGPFDGGDYFLAGGVNAYPYFLHLPHRGRMHLYRLTLRKRDGKLIRTYAHKGAMLPDGAEIK
jgi:hypothetical protein